MAKEIRLDKIHQDDSPDSLKTGECPDLRRCIAFNAKKCFARYVEMTSSEERAKRRDSPDVIDAAILHSNTEWLEHLHANGFDLSVYYFPPFPDTGIQAYQQNIDWLAEHGIRARGGALNLFLQALRSRHYEIFEFFLS